jgi:putative transposase
MRKSFKYRLLGNKQIFIKADEWLLLCQRLYNTALEERIVAWKRNHHSISAFDQKKELPELKQAFPEYKEVGSQVLQDVLERLDRAYKAFFKRVKNKNGRAGFPRFKGKDRYDSFTLKQTGWKLEGKYLSIKNIGRFKLKLSRPIEGDIKTVTIRRTSTGKWYVCFSCDNIHEKRLLQSDKIVGIDVGIKSFLVDSDGNKVDNPQYFRQSERLLRLRQRRLCRRVKGSQGRQRARILVAKAHEKVRNQRNDFLHKIANFYVKNYGVLIFEDLNIKWMVKNYHLAKPITDASWGTFIGLVSYKAEEAGRKLIRISRFEPSSKTCSECGAINQKLTLNDRQWVCKSCGVLHDRDYNAAKNIRRVGQTLQEITYTNVGKAYPENP